MAHPDQDARNVQGRYVRTPETVARQAEAARLHSQGLTYREIAEELGYASKQTAFNAVQAGFRHIAAPARDALQKRQQELDFLWEAAMEILENHHIVVSNGKVIEIDGEPLSDDGPRLQAIAELRQINITRRKLEGTDQPAKVEHSGGVTYEVVGISPEDLT